MLAGSAIPVALKTLPDLTRDVDGGGNDLAVLFGGGLLQAIEIIEERLPFGLETLVLAQAGEFLEQRQSLE